MNLHAFYFYMLFPHLISMQDVRIRRLHSNSNKTCLCSKAKYLAHVHVPYVHVSYVHMMAYCLLCVNDPEDQFFKSK